jgi:hypothetical protein
MRKSSKVHEVTGIVQWDKNAPEDVKRFEVIQMHNPHDPPKGKVKIDEYEDLDYAAVARNSLNANDTKWEGRRAELKPNLETGMIELWAYPQSKRHY